MKLLSRVAHLEPIAVTATGHSEAVYAAWASRTLLVQRSTASGTPIGGSQHRVAVGPGAYTTSPPPTAIQRWRGPVPEDLVAELAARGLTMAMTTPA